MGRNLKAVGAQALTMIAFALLVHSVGAQTLDDELQPWILVVTPANLTENAALDPLGLAVADSVELTLNLLGSYRVQPRLQEEQVPEGVRTGNLDALAAFTEERTLDYVVLGSVDRGDDGSFVIEMRVYDRRLQAITVTEVQRTRSVFDVFDAADRLTESALSAFSGQRIAFGLLRLAREGWNEGEYSVFIDGTFVARNTVSVPNVLIGERTVRIRAENGPQAGQTLLNTRVTINEGVATPLSFAMSAPEPVPVPPISEAEMGDGSFYTEGEDLSGRRVTVSGSYGSEVVARFDAAMAPFEQATGIDVVYESLDSFEDAIQAAVAAGEGPDIGQFPQPGLVAALEEQGYVEDVAAWFGRDYLAQQYSPAWLELAEIGGIQAGVWFNSAVKSLVWYNRRVFEDEGYAIPTTWDELIALSEAIAGDGYAPWSIGIESGAATGWTATDWLEEIMLRIHPVEVYDRWIAGDLPFDSPEVREAFDYLERIWFDDQLVLGGRSSIVDINWQEAARRITGGQPEAILHRQASFAASAILQPGVEFGTDVDFFYLPPIDPELGQPVLGSGELMVALTDRPEVRAVMRYLSSGLSTRALIAGGGFISPHRDTAPEWYSRPEDRSAAAVLQAATAFRFDASDLMPGAVGAGAFWSEVTEYVGDPRGDRDAMLASIDAAWPGRVAASSETPGQEEVEPDSPVAEDRRRGRFEFGVVGEVRATGGGDAASAEVSQATGLTATTAGRFPFAGGAFVGYEFLRPAPWLGLRARIGLQAGTQALSWVLEDESEGLTGSLEVRYRGIEIPFGVNAVLGRGQGRFELGVEALPFLILSTSANSDGGAAVTPTAELSPIEPVNVLQFGGGFSLAYQRVQREFSFGELFYDIRLGVFSNLSRYVDDWSAQGTGLRLSTSVGLRLN